MDYFLAALAFCAALPVATALRPADDHPCYRSCESSFPMTCVYNWTVEWYYTLASPQCGDCPSNAAHCSNADCFPADGVKRLVNLVNRVFPGPGVHICSGDEVVVNVTNDMLNSEGVTLHWHGIFQNGSQFMDGVPMVTQCPIPSPGSFEYSFTPYEPGTHWYHAHTGLNRPDGLMGPFVIREGGRTDPHAGLYDRDLAEHVVLVTDWMHDEMTKVYARYRWGDGASVDSILINGKGISVGTTPPHPPLEVFEVTQGLRYRFRVINGASFFCNMQFSVQGHSLLVIASDGGSFQPQAVNYFRINGGERIDFVLTANQSVDNYQIQVIGLNCTNTLGGPTKQIAHLNYVGASEPPVINELPDIKSSGAPSTWWQVLPGKSFAQLQSTDEDYKSTDFSKEHQEYLLVDFHAHIDPSTNTAWSYPQINRITYRSPSSPVLSQPLGTPHRMLCEEEDFKPGHCAGDDICSCVHTIHVEPNEHLEIILVNGGSRFHNLHPMHLHGQQFKVVAMDRIEGATVEMVRQMLNNGSIVRNENGARKDSVIVPDGGYTIFQFQGWNPGWWIFHCHIEFHLVEGILFYVHGDIPPKPVGFPTCGPWPSPSHSLDSTCRDPRTGLPTLAHLAWIVPLTFLTALVIGLACGRLVLQRKGARPRGGAAAVPTADPDGETTM